MSTRRRGRGRSGRPLLVVLALLGLLWMHGLGTHGTVEPAGAADTVTHAAHQEPAAAAEDHGDEGDHGGAGDHGGHVTAVGLCLALLLVAVLLTGRWRRGLLLRLRGATGTLATGLAPPAPRTRPPDLVALGVCRC